MTIYKRVGVSNGTSSLYLNHFGGDTFAQYAVTVSIIIILLHRRQVNVIDFVLPGGSAGSSMMQGVVSV